MKNTAIRVGVYLFGWISVSLLGLWYIENRLGTPPSVKGGFAIIVVFAAFVISGVLEGYVTRFLTIRGKEGE